VQSKDAVDIMARMNMDTGPIITMTMIGMVTATADIGTEAITTGINIRSGKARPVFTERVTGGARLLTSRSVTRLET
jgi:hypothetical protein